MQAGKQISNTKTNCLDMSKLILLTSCPADCDTDNILPAIPASQDCTSFDVPYSEVSDLYIMPTGATNPLTNWSTTPTATANAIDNTEELNAKSKWLVVRGSVTVTPEVVEYAKRKRKIASREYRAELLIDDVVNHYEFLRKLQCGGTGFTFWYGDLNDKIFGSAPGLAPESVDVVLDRGLGRDSRWNGKIVLTWTADGDPQMRNNPL